MPAKRTTEAQASAAAHASTMRDLSMSLHMLTATGEAAISTTSFLLYTTSKTNGFWPKEGRNDGECIALMHSELSEALEALRHGDPASAKIPGYSLVEEELADCIIRILDYSAANGLNVAGALYAKALYNLQRPYKHGKGF